MNSVSDGNMSRNYKEIQILISCVSNFLQDTRYDHQILLQTGKLYNIRGF